MDKMSKIKLNANNQLKNISSLKGTIKSHKVVRLIDTDTKELVGIKTIEDNLLLNKATYRTINNNVYKGNLKSTVNFKVKKISKPIDLYNNYYRLKLLYNSKGLNLNLLRIKSELGNLNKYIDNSINKEEREEYKSIISKIYYDCDASLIESVEEGRASTRLAVMRLQHTEEYAPVANTSSSINLTQNNLSLDMQAIDSLLERVGDNSQQLKQLLDDDANQD